MSYRYSIEIEKVIDPSLYHSQSLQQRIYCNGIV